jgi:hypothetical protein
MPEMELFGPDLRLGLISSIWTRLWAYMLWPHDEQQRKAHCAQPYVAALSSLDAKSQEDPDFADAYLILHSAFREIDGWAGVDHALKSRLRPRGRAGLTAAAVLDIVRRIPNKGSVNKAVHIIEETAKHYDLIGSKAGIMNAWKSHRSVAHLWMALILADEFHASEEFEDPKRLRQFLGIANDYQRFGVSYRAPRQQRPLIDPTEVWTIPADLRAAPRLRQPLSPLPRAMLAALAMYRPPKQL